MVMCSAKAGRPEGITIPNSNFFNTLIRGLTNANKNQDRRCLTLVFKI